MNDNFKNSIKQNITKDDKPENKISVNGNNNTENKFKLFKKKMDKTSKKAFNVYMESGLIKELDKVSKKSGYSRNELINIMCDWCINNLDFQE